MMDSIHNKKVTVIIATTADKQRKNQLKNAINSVLNQQGCLFGIMVVINGNRFDVNVREHIEKHKQIQNYYLSEGNFPKALKVAREQVKTDYFCFLDDDDELLPNSLSSRLEVLESNKDIDVVIGNGLKRHSDTLELETHPEILSYQKSSLEALFKVNGNWLASCAGMFRTETITQDYFDDYAVYAEWTYIAFKLALYKKLYFIKEKCYRINVSSESLSHNEAYLLGQYAMTEKVLLLALPLWARRSFVLKKRDMEHDLAERYLHLKQMKKAWLYHIKSLANITSFTKYILFTRYLFYKNGKR